jgi:pyrophosphatase PpaX
LADAQTDGRGWRVQRLDARGREGQSSATGCRIGYHSWMRPALLFDLDGTLIDSIELILNSARYAFADAAGRRPTDDEWRAGIGRPLHHTIREWTDTDAEAERILGRYREYQGEHHDRLVHAYDGIVDTLHALSAEGHKLALVTSKMVWLAERGLTLVGLADVIPVVVGCDICTNHKPHPEPVELALALLGIAAGDAIFVGDSPHDVQSGNAAGVFTVGVTWGAFNVAQMAASGANEVINGIDELRGVIARFNA